MIKIANRWKYVLASAAVVALGLLVWQSVRHYEAIRAGLEKVTGLPVAAGTYETAIYFADFEYTRLVPEKRRLRTPDTPEGKIRQVVEELIAGPDDPRHSPTLPAEARLRGVFIKEGVATLNLSEEVQSRKFGTTGEMFAVNSIFRTVVANEPTVYAVRLTVEGKRQNAFCGENGTVYSDFAIIAELGPTVSYIPPPGKEEQEEE